MGQSFAQIAGTMPDPSDYKILTFRQRLVETKLARLTAASKARGTTYYVDSAAAGGGDGSVGSPFNDLAQVRTAIAAGSGDQRFVFVGDSEFIGAASYHEWFAGDGGHDAAVYDYGKTGITFEWDGIGTPPVFRRAASLITNNDSCFRLEGDDIILDLGDESASATLVGWGYDTGDDNTHDYAVSVGPQGTNEVTVAHVGAYDGSAHLIASWWPTGQDKAGGYVNFIRCHGDRGSSLFGRVINCYHPDGGTEYFVYDCYADDATIHVVNGHTADSNEHAAIWIDSCIRGGQAFYSSDVADEKLVTFGCRAGSPASPVAPLFGPGIIINSEFWLTTTGNGVTSSTFNPTMYNVVLSLVDAGTQNDFVGTGVYSSSVSAAAILDQLNHCAIRLVNPTGASKRGVGYACNTLQNNDQPTGAVVSRSVWVGEPGSSSYPCAPGVGDSDTRQIKCSYVGMSTTTSRNQAGYANVTTATELSASPMQVSGDVWSLVPTNEMVRQEAPAVGYDFFGRRRKVEQSTDGPIELYPSYMANTKFLPWS